jgi:hypothetical protein
MNLHLTVEGDQLRGELHESPLVVFELFLNVWNESYVELSNTNSQKPDPIFF